jgi:hypothetical protein
VSSCFRNYYLLSLSYDYDKIGFRLPRKGFHLYLFSYHIYFPYILAKGSWVQNLEKHQLSWLQRHMTHKYKDTYSSIWKTHTRCTNTIVNICTRGPQIIIGWCIFFMKSVTTNSFSRSCSFLKATFLVLYAWDSIIICTEFQCWSHYSNCSNIYYKGNKTYPNSIKPNEKTITRRPEQFWHFDYETLNTFWSIPRSHLLQPTAGRGPSNYTIHLI